MDNDIQKIISSKHCARCGGDADGWKCSQCGQTSMQFEPMHKCGGGTFQPKCAACEKAEDNCTCRP